MNILLMNGHGGTPYDSGATGNGYKEAVLTRELADLVEAKLKKYATVKRYPKDRNAFADVQAGTFTSYVPGGIKNIDYAFEIHFNAFGSGAHGSECYVTSAESGITVEQAIMKNMSKFFTLRDNDSIFDGVKRTNFAVIQTCKNYGVSGALLETCFIDNADDIAVYKSNKDAIADVIVDGIAEGFGLKASSGSSTSTGTSTSKPSSGSSSSSNKKSISQIAKEVINGKWGNGDTRKKKLEAAGYDYDAVQKEVNKQLGVSTSTVGTSKPSSKKKTVTLPASVSSWRVYPTNKAPVIGNECGYLYPSKFGGLTYDILATPQTDVVTIQTRDYGKVNIYVAKSTGAIIK